jgi:hypothetical protein
MLAQLLTCVTATITVTAGSISVQCTPATPTPIPVMTPTATPAPTPAPPVSLPTSAAQTALACVGSVVNGSPLPACLSASVFPGSGVYRRAIPASAAADPASAAMVAAYFGARGGGSDLVSGLMWHAGTSQTPYSFGRPIYAAKSSDPLVSVHCTTYCAMGDATVRIPTRAAAEGGSDHHLAVLEPDNTIFDAWEWSGVSAGKATAGSLAISTVDGTSYSSADLQPGWMRNAVTAGGMITPAGIITLAELQAGVIQHELYGVLVCTASTWDAPATQTARVCTDGRVAIPDGALLQYVPDGAAIAASNMSAESKIIALAMHTYGVRIADTGGSPGLAIQVENQAPFWAYGSGADPFVAYAVQHGWNHVTNASASPAVDRYIHPLTDLNLPGNLRVLAVGN